MKAAAKAWGCVCLLYCLLSIAAAVRRSPEIPFRLPTADELTIYFIYLMATVLVTFLSAACLVGPYVRCVKPDRLARRPWRMYLDTGLLALLAVALLTPFVKAQVDSFAITFAPLAIFALGVSTAATFFYLQELRYGRL